MTYSKPELKTLANAIKVVESSQQDKGVMTLRDSQIPHPFNATQNAYEADE